MSAAQVARAFRRAYAAHRAVEGRGGPEGARTLPYVHAGPLADQWRIRARTFECFLERVVAPRERSGLPLTALDLGAGNGWLAHRLAERGHSVLALDVRVDEVDGLGAGRSIWRASSPWALPVAAGFEAIPLRSRSVDLAIFNASLHYALDLRTVLAEARRVVRSRGVIVILDSPFYRRAADGEAMVAEKRRMAPETFGTDADALTALPFIEYLTRERLAGASEGLHLTWRRHRVSYPLRYELRPLAAALKRRRRPSRFDVWEARVP